jgi:hypothetical protein
LEQSSPEGVQFLERPQRPAFLRGMARGRAGHHLEFAEQIVGEQSGQKVHLIAQALPHRHIRKSEKTGQTKGTLLIYVGANKGQTKGTLLIYVGDI